MSKRTSNYTASIALWTAILHLLAGCQAPFPAPSIDIQMDSLEGVWETRYSEEQTDRLILRSDGVYKQVFQSGERVLETEWNPWELEHLPSGNVRAVFEQGRFNASQAGLPINMEFYDPFEGEIVRMRNKLVLQVRTDSAGNLILHHLFTDPDNGFLLVGGQRRYFQRVYD